MASMSHDQWFAVVRQKRWESITVGPVSFKADPACGESPFWFTADDIPLSVTGTRYTEVDWSYDDTGWREFPANIEYVSMDLMKQREGFAQLHGRCLEKGVALKGVTTASTPNLEVAILLVASFKAPAPGGAALQGSNTDRRPNAASELLFRSRSASSSFGLVAQPHCAAGGAATGAAPAAPAAGQQGGLNDPRVGGPGGPHPAAPVSAAAAAEAANRKATVGAAAAAGPTPRPKPCFNAYFLPFKPGRDVRQDNVWLKRRLAERRNRDKDRGKDILTWREDRRLLSHSPGTGLPVFEENVSMHGYWDRDQSQLGSWHWAPVAHCCLVESVLPGRAFIYSMRPWWQKPDAPPGTLEPVMSDTQEDFLRECDCQDAECGKLRAREDLMVLRERGSRYLLEIRQASMPGEGRTTAAAYDTASPRQQQVRELGVFAGEDIPGDTYVVEYVGEWLPAGEPEKREAEYEPAGLHYLYDMSHRYELESDKERERERKRCVMATAAVGGGGGGGGVGIPGGGGCGGRDRKRRPPIRGRGEGDGDVPRVVDATHLGNVARFVNHRCEGANLVSVNVCMGKLDETHMTIMLRTTREIKLGEELTLDYQAGMAEEEKAKIRANPQGKVDCRCGSARCLGKVFPERDATGNRSAARRIALGTRTLGPTAAAANAAAAITISSESSDTSSDDGGDVATEAAAAAVAAGGLAGEEEEEGAPARRPGVEEEEEVGECCTSVAGGTASRWNPGSAAPRCSSASPGPGAGPGPGAKPGGLPPAAVPAAAVGAVRGATTPDPGCERTSSVGTPSGVGAVTGAGPATSSEGRWMDSPRGPVRSVLKRQRLALSAGQDEAPSGGAVAADDVAAASAVAPVAAASAGTAAAADAGVSSSGASSTGRGDRQPDAVGAGAPAGPALLERSFRTSSDTCGGGGVGVTAAAAAVATAATCGCPAPGGNHAEAGAARGSGSLVESDPAGRCPGPLGAA